MSGIKDVVALAPGQDRYEMFRREAETFNGPILPVWDTLTAKTKASWAARELSDDAKENVPANSDKSS